MRIGLDARSLTLPHLRGIGRSLWHLYRRLPALRPDDEFILYHQRALPTARDTDDAPWRQPNVRLQRIDMPGDRLDLWRHVRLPWAAWRDKLDLLHCPASVAPRWSPAPILVTIHDLIPICLPGEVPAAERRQFRRTLRGTLRAARRVVAISNATRDDLGRMFHIPARRISVIPWAADPEVVAACAAPLSDAERERVRGRYNVQQRWLVTFAGASPRKNARRVLAGFAQVSPEVRRSLQVVLIGAHPERYRQALRQEATDLGIEGDVRVLDFVPQSDVCTLLRGASGLLMPSHYEGFGLPILDAFACGTPVLTSPISSMPEIAGDAAVYCDPHDATSIAAGIGRLLDGATADRLAAMGTQRLRLFSWDRAAEATSQTMTACVTRASACATGPCDSMHEARCSAEVLNE